MLKRLIQWPAKFIKYPGLHYGEPKIRYTPSEEANKPVVLLFGWLGATERYLGKYTKLYHDKGYETIHYIPPMGLIFFPSKIPDLNAQIQADLVRIMKEKGLLRRPFLLHVFSNSGYISWMFFQRYIRKQLPNNAYNIYYRLHGSIIDSAPCRLDPSVLGRGFMGALFPNIDGHKHPIVTPIMEWFWRTYMRLNGNPELFGALNKLMTSTILPYPQTYLFSSGDTMIYASEIKKHIARMQKRTGLPSSSLDFVTSNHVAHYRAHPTAYSKRIDAILTRVETNWESLLETLATHTAQETPKRAARPKRRSKRVTPTRGAVKRTGKAIKDQSTKSL